MERRPTASSGREAAVALTYNLNVSGGCLPSLTLFVRHEGSVLADNANQVATV
jgi:hypothetical protein